jgi:soluble lytic murein transglycosylase-like protein
MSTEALTSTINAPDALAASQRVAQLQELVAQAGQAGSTQSFAAALAAASSPSSAASSSAAAATSSGASSLPTASSLSTASSLPATYTSAANSSTAATPTPYEPPADMGSNGSSAYDALITQAAQRNGLDPAILHGLIQQESDFNPSSQSSAGAAGLTQLMPGTASAMGVSNPLDPAQSIEGGARYLGQLMSEFGGNTTDALAAYNAGPGAVKQYGGVPPYAETQDYVTKVLGYANAYRQSQPTAVGTLPAASNTAIPTATGSIQ